MNSDKTASTETESVVQSVRRGDRGALEALFANHRPYLRQLVGLRMDDALRLRLDASDIVQEAHLEALRRVEEYAREPKLPVRLWMRRIAIDRLAMARRRYIGAEKRTLKREFALPNQSAVSLAQQFVAGVTSPSGEVARAELIAAVRDAIGRLNDDDREIVLLQALEGLNSTESGQVLGIEPATARKRFGRALLRLRQLLAASGLGGPSA